LKSLGKKVYAIIVAVIVVVASIFGWVFFSPKSFPETSAGPITLTFNATAGDTQDMHSSIVYATSHDQANAANNVTSGTMRIGQSKISTTYAIYRCMFPFNTASIPKGMTISSIIFSLNVTLKECDISQFYIETLIKSASAPAAFPHTNGLWLSDYNHTFWEGAAQGNLDTTSISSVNIYYNITLNSTALLVPRGMTYVLVRSQREIVLNVPAAKEDVQFSCNETGFPAKLYVTGTYASNILWTSKFDGTSTDGWMNVGALPYLNNSTANYITTSSVTGNDSWFLFEPTDLATVQASYLRVEGVASFSPTERTVTAYLDNGVTQVAVNFTFLMGRYTWSEYNTTSFLNSITKINDFKVSMYNFIESFQSIRVVRMYLRLYNGPKETAAPTHYGAAGISTTICVKWLDNTGLNAYKYSHNATGSWSSNTTGIFAGSPSEAWSNFTVTMPTDTSKVVAAKIYANDTANNWEAADLIYVWTIWEGFNPSTSISTIVANVDASGHCHSLGRKIIHDPNITKLYWAFYWEEPYYQYSTSSDGFTWIYGDTFQYTSTATQQTGMFYVTPEIRDGHSYIHYNYCNETANADLFYRRGELFANRTIIWTPLQTARAYAGIPSFTRFAPNGLAITPSGYVFYAHFQENSTSREIFVTFSNKTDGTWATYPGYPKVASDFIPPAQTQEAYIYALTDDDAYVIFRSVANYQLAGRKILNHVMQANETISAYGQSEGRRFSGISDKGVLYLVYRTNETTPTTKGRIRFSQRNANGSWSPQDYEVSTICQDNTYPVISLEGTGDLLFNWLTTQSFPEKGMYGIDDESIWLLRKNATAWKPVERIGIVPDNWKFPSDPNHVVPFVALGRAMIAFMGTNLTDNSDDQLFAFSYFSAIHTSMSVGWNNFTATLYDVAHTLGEVNASLTYDGISWTMFAFQYANGTRYTFIKDFGGEDSILITADGKFFVLVSAIGVWNHIYP
jgi:hypothetical protein